MRLDEVSGTLSALEIEDLVTLRDAVAVVQRLEMVRRIADEIAGYVVELGTDGRLLALQLDELMAGVETDRTLVIRDYLPPAGARGLLDDALADLDQLSATELIDLVAVAKALGYPATTEALDAAGQSARVPAAGQGAAAAGHRGGAAGGPLRQPAAAARGDRGGSAGGRTGSATPVPVASGKGCPGWPRRRSWNATSSGLPSRSSGLPLAGAMSGCPATSGCAARLERRVRPGLPPRCRCRRSGGPGWGRRAGVSGAGPVRPGYAWPHPGAARAVRASRPAGGIRRYPELARVGTRTRGDGVYQ